MIAVEVQNLSKNYPLSGSQLARFRHVFARGKARFEEGLWALRNVSFTVERGEAFGIVGANGSGKSTLLQMIAGILRPTSGSVHVGGRLSALLELGSGFSPEFTGRDNVYLNASLLGLSRPEIDERFETIERFAGIGDFIEQPTRTYSTGMVLRLAFAVAAHVDPEILIVDEALAVGDISFRQRCMRKIHDLRSHGTTLLFVSHETSDVKALCARCLWLQNGVAQEVGETDDVVAKYLSAAIGSKTAGSKTAHVPAPEIANGPETASAPYRYGDQRAAIIGGTLVDSAGHTLGTLTPLDRVVLKIRFRVDGELPSPVVGFLVRNSKGENIFGTNTTRENYALPIMAAGEIHTVDFHWIVPALAPGPYHISLAITDGDLNEFQVCDYIEDAISVTAGAASVLRGARGYFQLRCAAVAIHPAAMQ